MKYKLGEEKEFDGIKFRRINAIKLKTQEKP